MVFAQMYTVLKDFFEPDGHNLSHSMVSIETSPATGPSRAMKPDISFIKQFLIEFEFLKSVAE